MRQNEQALTYLDGHDQKSSKVQTLGLRSGFLLLQEAHKLWVLLTLHQCPNCYFIVLAVHWTVQPLIADLVERQTDRKLAYQCRA